MGGEHQVAAEAQGARDAARGRRAAAAPPRAARRVLAAAGKRTPPRPASPRSAAGRKSPAPISLPMASWARTPVRVQTPSAAPASRVVRKSGAPKPCTRAASSTIMGGGGHQGGDPHEDFGPPARRRGPGRFPVRRRLSPAVALPALARVRPGVVRGDRRRAPGPEPVLEHRRTGARPGFETPGGGERFADLDSGMEFPDGRLPFPDFVRRRRPQHPPGQRLAAGIGPPIGEPLEQLFRAEEVQVHAQLRLSQFADPVEAAGKPLIVLERRTALRRSAAADRGRRSAGLVGVSFGVAVHPEGGAMVELGDAVHLLRPAPSPIVGEDEAGEDRRRHEQPPQRKKPGLPADERQRHRRRRHRQAGARDAAHLTDERRRLLHTIVGPAPELVVVGGRSGSHGAPRAERRPRAARNRS